MTKIVIFAFLSFFTICDLSASDSLSKIESLKSHSEYLSSDLFQGRATGSLGGFLSSKYISYFLDKYNIDALGDNHTFYQNVQFHSIKAKSNLELIIYSSTSQDTIKYYNDFLFFNINEQNYFETAQDIVFVGYGIIAPEYDYNDYENIDVKGKIVVLLDQEPISTNDNFFEGANKTIYSNLDFKLNTAISRGANGVIVIPITTITSTKEKNEIWSLYQNIYFDEDVNLASMPDKSSGILIHPSKVDILFKNSDFNYNKIFLAHTNHTIKSFELGTRISIRGNFETKDFVAHNVLGILKSKNNNKEKVNNSIIISAHYDHLGIGKAYLGDSIYNGFLDNALGVAAILEISRLCSEYNNFDNNIIFIFTIGEEKGLLGSKYYTINPKFPLFKTIANINIDGIAFIDEFKSIVTVGSEYSSFQKIIGDFTNSNQILMDTLPDDFAKNIAFSTSDQFSFAQAGIPSILIQDGFQYKNLSKEKGLEILKNYSSNLYHTVYDDINHIKINYNASKQHTDLIFNFIKYLDKCSILPTWNKGTKFQNSFLKNKALEK